MECTYCGGTDFYEGPSGGLSTNILCANDDCRHWFNHTPFGLEDLERVEPTKEERENQEDEAEKIKQKEMDALYNKGKEMFKAGESSKDCLKDSPHYGPSNADLLRLCGYIDAMRTIEKAVERAGEGE